jgi:predicted Zn-dependent protease
MSITRRQFSAGACGCALLALAGRATAQGPSWLGARQLVEPGYAPAAETDEKGIWSLMDRAERDIRDSRFLIREREISAYIRDIICRLAGRHCPDVRAYLVRTPQFNASMAPNGMMQIWTGLLLRCRDEAQVAAVIGHELGHYLRRHSIERWRDVRTRANVSAFLGLGLRVAGGPGWVGAVTDVVLLASMFAFTREQEREADEIGLNLMADAGYAPAAVPEVWAQLIAELEKSTADRDRALLFATHPEPEERVAKMRELSKFRGAPAGDRGAERYRSRLEPIRALLVRDELALRQYGRSEFVFDQLLQDAPDDGLLWYAKGELYRLRAAPDDGPKALAAYRRALEAKDAPAESHRGIGLVELNAGARERARDALETYLKAKPGAVDAEALRSLLTP